MTEFRYLDDLISERAKPRYPNLTGEGFLYLGTLLGISEPNVLHAVRISEEAVYAIMLPVVFDRLFAKLEAVYSEDAIAAVLRSHNSDPNDFEAMFAYLKQYMLPPEPPDPDDVVPMSAYTDEMWQAALDYFGHKCAYCGASEGLLRGFTFVREHYIPVSSPDCPGATPDNIVVACHSCNSHKNSRDAADWLVSRFGERKARRILSRIDAYFEHVRDAERLAAGK